MRPLLLLAMAAALSAQDRCALLSTIGLERVNITSAQLVPASPAGQFPGRGPNAKLPVAVPEHCLIRGAIDPRTGFDNKPFAIGFELRLPTPWQRRFLFQGGGGMDGAVRPAIGWASGADQNPALARGFAVASTDAGHTGAPPAPETDPSFARDQQARIDNAYRSIERVTEVSRAIVRRYYGETWAYAYFDGCSNGGRQGMMAAQRLPLLFDGVVSGAPAFRVTHAGIGSAWETIGFLKIAPKNDAGQPIVSKAFSDADLKLTAEAILKACDALDGAADGMVFNYAKCRFNPAVLACKGAKRPACLSAPQVAALRRAMDGPRNSRGESLYSDFPWDPGIAAPGWRAWKLGTSLTAEPNSADVRLMLSGLKGYFAYPYDEAFDPLKFNFDKDAARVDDTALLQDPTSTALGSFIQHGGKMIFYHGTADPVFSSLDTTRYFERASRDNSQDFARLYLVPGMNHCAGGPALDDFDALQPLVRWVEAGEKPREIIAKGNAFPGVSRPLCPHPQYAQYNGSGDPNNAANYSCRQP